ncbi:MAG TPA: cupredoxin domain-containing protein [Vicinamibacteria bacterium]|nr:cupredoxin domain-containing protein [Vicinamibacteria bacterium]
MRQRLLLMTLALSAGASPTPADAPVKTFEVAASRYKFDPESLEVDEGDRVVLKMRSVDVAHGLAVKEFNAKAAIPKGGEVVTLEFVASKAGTYAIECSEYCGRGHKGMKGQIVVHPKAAGRRDARRDARP